MRGFSAGKNFILLSVLIIALIFSGSSCDKVMDAVDDIKGGDGGGGSVKEDSTLPDRDNTPQVLVNEAPGISTFTGNGATVDYSNAADGYIMVKYEGSSPKVKLRIINSAGGDNGTYTYDLVPNSDFQAFPFSLGSGDYTAAVYTNVSGDEYATAAQENVSASIADDFQPFLRSNQFVDFTSGTAAVAKGQEVCLGSKSDIGAVEKIFKFVTKNVSYDYDKAATVQSGYLPNVDETMNSGKGICFDYAALTACMLRSQRIPTKLVVGYAGEAYHAWISVYLTDLDGGGEWVDNIIEFHNDTWTFMDPTFVSGGDNNDPNLVGTGTSYNPMYYY